MTTLHAAHPRGPVAPGSSTLTNGTAQHMHSPGGTPRDPEARLSAYFAQYAAGDGRAARHLARHPMATLRALQDLRGIPVVQVDLGEDTESGLVADALPATVRGPRSLAAVLELPSTREAFSLGASKQTLRRKARAAERAGVTWSAVDDPEQRRSLLDLANEYERSHPLQQYRKAPPDNPALLQVGQWLLASGADGRPLLLSITPVGGTAALLGLFRTLEVTDEASNARYLMTRVMAEHLIDRGVTHLFDGVHPANLTNGLRHFQRMMGYRLVRVDRRAAASIAVARTPLRG